MKPTYNDGLDDDGYPIVEPYRQPYARGSEADIGENFNPISIGSALANAVKRIGTYVSIGDNSESPIELQLGAAVLLCFERHGKNLKMCVPTELEQAQGLVLVPQYRWGIYRSDWALYNPRTRGALLVECDGAAFHSSCEQLAHDQRKDAAAHDRGYLTIRFSGSQINRNADQCAEQIFEIVYGGARGSHS